MKYVDEFRDARLAKQMAQWIRQEAREGVNYAFMEFCGGHTHTLFRYGIPEMLPANVRMVHGPGCPVCVLPMGRIDGAIELACQHQVILCTYGDMLRVPGSEGISLLQARSKGADVRMVYSCAEALTLARNHPAREVVFFAIGFETTTPPTAVLIQQAHREGLTNFSVYCNHVLTPAAITYILESPEVRELGVLPLTGFMGPGHVSAVIGSRPYEYFAEEYQKPVVIAGFEPLDLLQSIGMLVRQNNEGRAVVEVQFSRAVSRDGNSKAKALVAEVFELRKTFPWRGLGLVPYSALRIKQTYAALDAEQRFALTEHVGKEPAGCACGAILRGVKTPLDCKLFGTVCTPEHPIGSCMVSSEGACAAYHRYGRYREPVPQPPAPATNNTTIIKEG